ncbi:MFS transporter [Mesorhizobium sp. SB112]|uniref:MFS transporter n=1 Tax=Mesorhizobium sp. SB112 TaxID=3151853 RepID=UPI0032642CB0
MDQPLTSHCRRQTHLAVLLVLSLTHLLNDLMQSLIPAVYPILKEAYALDFVQIGMITLTFQISASLLQPIIGHYTDSHPMPYSTVVGMAFTLAGLVGLGLASSYGLILLAAACIGIGSSIFHPEATRMARNASGGRQGLAQGIFQVGGQMGGALGPLLAALVIVPRGQASLTWFALVALLAIGLMIWSAGRHIEIRKQVASAKAVVDDKLSGRQLHAPKTVLLGLIILSLLMFSKNAYVESFRSFYTFYLMDRFSLPIQTSQLMLFVFLLASALGVLIGGILGDKIGRYRVIWISILGPLPLTLLLPYVGFVWTGILTVLINLIMASAFASILIYAMELAPNRIGLIGGLFYGLNFGMGGIAAAMLGGMADTIGIEQVYRLCSLLPLAGLLAWFLPRLDDRHAGQGDWPTTESGFDDK